MTSNHIETVAVILLFATWYLSVLLRRTAEHKIDLYDLVMLSAVAVVPTFFVLFPATTQMIAGMVGVAFPFVLLFGMLLAVLFIFIHRLTVKLHKLEHDNRLLIQELSLLRHNIENQVSPARFDEPRP